MSSQHPQPRRGEVPDHGTDEPTVGRPLNAPERRPFGKVLVLTVVVFAVLILGYLAAVQWLVD